MLNTKQSVTILSVILAISLIANGWLYYYIKNNANDFSLRNKELELRRNDVRELTDRLENLSEINQKLQKNINVFEEEKKQNEKLQADLLAFKNVKWLKYENKDFGISFEYPNIWGEIPVISTDTLGVEPSNDDFKRCVGDNAISQFSQGQTNIQFSELSFDILKYSNSAPLHMVFGEDCWIINLLDLRKKIQSRANISVGGFRGYSSSVIVMDGSLRKELQIFVNNLYVKAGINLGYYKDWSNFIKSGEGDIVERIIVSDPDSIEVKKVSENVKLFTKFVASIKFTK